MKKFFSIIIAVIVFITACNNDGFKTTKSGIKYKFELQNKGAQKPELGDVLELKMKYAVNDSIIFDSDKHAPSIPFKLDVPAYQGDIMEGIAMLALGDSAVFIISADSFFLKNVGLKELPPFVKEKSNITFYISLIAIKKKEVFEKEQLEIEKQRNAMLEIQKSEELNSREMYLKKNNINQQPQKSGLYYIETLKGKGKTPDIGTVVQVHYKGMLLDGSTFDSSYQRNEPITFKMGAGQLIPGFEEGISYMKEGGKALLIMPSDLAYGEQELENIPPYSTLVYEVELVKVD